MDTINQAMALAQLMPRGLIDPAAAQVFLSETDQQQDSSQ